MINRNAKGARNERRAKEYFEEKGYFVSKTIRSRFNNNDFFGLFDLICVKKDSKIVFVQVKSNYIRPVLVREYEEKTAMFPREYCTILLVAWSEKKREWIIHDVL